MTNPSSSGDSSSPKHVNPFLKLIFFVVAIIVMPPYEAAKALLRKTYDEADTPLPVVIGAIAGLIGGIATGYWLGWVRDASWAWWLPPGIVATALTFIYIWPLIYLGIMKQA